MVRKNQKAEDEEESKRKPDAVMKLQYSSKRYHLTMMRKVVEKFELEKGDNIEFYADEDKREIVLKPQEVE